MGATSANMEYAGSEISALGLVPDERIYHSVRSVLPS